MMGAGYNKHTPKSNELHMTSLPTPIAELPQEQFTSQLARLVGNALNKENWSYSCEGEDLTVEEVSAPDGLLPLVLWKAGQTLEKIWGPQELVFRCDPDALCGVVPEPKRPIVPLAVWLYAVHYELETAALATPGGSAPLDEWFKGWNDALRQKKVLLLAPLPPSAKPNNSRQQQ